MCVCVYMFVLTKLRDSYMLNKSILHGVIKCEARGSFKLYVFGISLGEEILLLATYVFHKAIIAIVSCPYFCMHVYILSL